MLDEARHFFGVEKVKELLDMMADYKLNRFHWHLSDNQGWRIEIKAFPELTRIGAIGCDTDKNAPARFYTQDEIREIVRYAAERHIEVIPEIDMPGHARALVRSIPQIDENLLFEPANIPTPEQQAEEKKEEKKEEQKEGDDVEIGDFDDFDDEPAKNQQLEERGEFFDDFDTNNNQQEDNRQNQQLEERGEFFDDFDINNNQQEDNRQNQQEEDRGEYLDDIDADTKTEPVKTEPVKTEPVKTEPVKTEPVKTEPVKTEPVKTEPVKTEPVKTEPVKTEPVKTEPVKTEPVKTEEQTQPVKQEEWDGNVEDFDDEPVQQQEEETEEWDGNVEDFDVDPKNGVIDNSGETDDWDDEDDEDYIF